MVTKVIDFEKTRLLDFFASVFDHTYPATEFNDVDVNRQNWTTFKRDFMREVGALCDDFAETLPEQWLNMSRLEKLNILWEGIVEVYTGSLEELKDGELIPKELTDMISDLRVQFEGLLSEESFETEVRQETDFQAANTDWYSPERAK